MRYNDVNLWGIYPSAADVTVPDHPDLVASGCWEKTLGAGVFGLLGGGSIGGLYAGISSLRAGLRGFELFRTTARNSVHVGTVTSFVFYMYVWSECWH